MKRFESLCNEYRENKRLIEELQAIDYSVAPEAPVRNFEQQLSGRNSSALR